MYIKRASWKISYLHVFMYLLNAVTLYKKSLYLLTYLLTYLQNHYENQQLMKLYLAQHPDQQS